MTNTPCYSYRNNPYDSDGAYRRASDWRPSPDTARMPSGYAYETVSGARPRHAATVRKPAGFGKAFLGGMLDAALTCALAFGGFTAWNGFNESTAPLTPRPARRPRPQPR